jgi:predicted PurR-regulated permease PerM
MQLNDMSFLTILTLISISVPGIATLINSVLLNLIYLDILMTDRWLAPLFTDENQSREIDKPLNNYFEENGFSTRQYTRSVGATLVFVAIYLFFLFLMLLFLSLGGRSQRYFRFA